MASFWSFDAFSQLSASAKPQAFLFAEALERHFLFSSEAFLLASDPLETLSVANSSDFYLPHIAYFLDVSVGFLFASGAASAAYS